MPELPEVETVRTGLDAALKGSKIAGVTLRRADLRIPFPENMAARLAGKTIESIRRRAKYLLFDLGGGDVLIAHLGMSGRFSVVPKFSKKLGTHDHVVITLTDGRALIYNDPRRFGLMTIAQSSELTSHPLFAALGPEPLEKEFSTAYLKLELTRRNTAVKVALMDQALVVGVGNIYASEALFLAGIDPNIPAKTVADRAKPIIAVIRKVLTDAIESGGSSLRDFMHVSGESGYFQHRFNVYGREGKPCFSCGEPVRSTRLSGRSTFFCPHCQK